MRTCPNGLCRLCHDDSVGQCPECGANMNRAPDAPRDPNAVLYAARDQAMREGVASRTRSWNVPADLVDVAREVMDDPSLSKPLTAADVARYS